MRRDEKRQQIMRAAEKLFTTRRFHEITLDDVIREAGVGKGTVYRYFKDKDDLFFQTATSGLDELCELLRQKVPEKAPFQEQLLTACLAISAFFARRRQLFRMMQSEEARLFCGEGPMRARWMEKRKALVAALGEIIRKGVREGCIRSDIPADVLANFLLGMLRTRARDLADAPPAVQRHELVLDLFCNGAGRGVERR